MRREPKAKTSSANSSRASPDDKESDYVFVGKWAPQSELVNGIESLFAAALSESNLERVSQSRKINTKARRDGLLRDIRIEPSQFNRWKNGTDARGIAKTTEKLMKLFSGTKYIDAPYKSDPHHPENEPLPHVEDIQFAKQLFKFWQRSRGNELKAICLLLTNHQQKIRGLVVEDANAKDQIVRLELLAAQTEFIDNIGKLSPTDSSPVSADQAGKDQRQVGALDKVADIWLSQCRLDYLGKWSVDPSGWPISLAASVGLDRGMQISVCFGIEATRLHGVLSRVEEILTSVDQLNRFPRRNWSINNGWFAESSTESCIIEIVDLDLEEVKRDSIAGVVQRHYGLHCTDPVSALVFAFPAGSGMKTKRVVEVLRDYVGKHYGASVDLLIPIDSSAYRENLRTSDLEFFDILGELETLTTTHDEVSSRSHSTRLKGLLAWLRGATADDVYFRSLSKRNLRLIISAGRLGFGHSNLSPIAASRCSALIRAAAEHVDLLYGLRSLPIEQNIVMELIKAPVKVRAIAGLVTVDELKAVPAPWFHIPIETWRHGRGLRILREGHHGSK